MTAFRTVFPAVLLATLALAFGAQTASAQMKNCAPRDKILSLLSNGYAEEPTSLGVTSKGGLLEVLTSPSGTWSIVITLPDGPTCLVDHGDGWHEAKPKPKEPLA